MQKGAAPYTITKQPEGTGIPMHYSSQMYIRQPHGKEKKLRTGIGGNMNSAERGFSALLLFGYVILMGISLHDGQIVIAALWTVLAAGYGYRIWKG